MSGTRLDLDLADVDAATDSVPLLVDPAERDRVRSEVARRLLGDRPTEPKIGRFHVLRTLGKGGMGTVYAAYDEHLDRKVAIKIIRDEHREVHDRTLREAQALASLSHPNVVPVYEVGVHEGRLFIAMEFVKGETLRAWHAAAPRTWRETIAMYRQAALGLAAAHDAGLVHRDFKPDNAIVGSDGRVRVLDFGLARRDAADDARIVDVERTPSTSSAFDTPLTRTGALMGTPAYMAPEQFLGGATDARTDQFALCVALFEALFGARPFAGTTAEAIGTAVTRGDVRTPSKTSVPGWVRAVVLRGLLPERDARWPSMRALIDALDDDPARRRRRLGAVLGVATIAVGVWGGARFVEHRRAAACDEAAAAIGSVWDDGARERVRVAMTDASPIGAANFELATPWIDAWVESWSTSRRDACAAKALEQGDLQARSDACFAERQDELAMLVEDLSHANAMVTADAVGAASQLDAVARCGDPVWLARWPFPPADIAADVAAQRHTLREIETSYRAGMYREAYARAGEVVAAAESIGWTPLVAEARLHQGRLGARIAEPHAVELIESAFLEAGAIGYDDLAADAASRLVAAVTLVDGGADAALHWGRIAEMLMTRLDEPASAPRRGMLAVNLGNAYAMRDDPVRAEAELEKAIEIWTASLGPDHPDIGIALRALASRLLGRGELERAEAYAQRAAELALRTLGPDHPRTSYTLSALGSIQTERGDRRGLATLRRVLETHERIDPEGHYRLVEVLDELGVAHINFGEWHEAAAYLERALAVAERELPADKASLSVVLSNLGNARAGTGDRAGAIAALERAVAIDEASEPDSVALANSLLNLGSALGEAGRADEALVHLERGREILERKLGADHLNVALANANVAAAMLVQGKAAEALPRAEAALAAIEAKVGSDHRYTLESIGSVGNALLGVGRKADARAMFERGLAIIDRQNALGAMRAGLEAALARAQQ